MLSPIYFHFLKSHLDPKNYGQTKLLLVAYNERIRKVMKTFYSPAFDEVIECRDGAKAIVEYKRSQPEWIVMDIIMKEMDGITATKKIIISQYKDEAIVEASIESGAKGFVNKENLGKIEKIIKTI